MASNYLTMKEDEKNIYEMFIQGFRLFLTEIEEVANKFKDGYDADKLFEESLKFDKSNIVLANDIIDECVWSIQKNEPRANHLRFFISLINSCYCLKRNSAYLVNFTKFYRKQQEFLDKTYIQEIYDLFSLTINYIKKLFGLFKKFPIAINEEEYTSTFDTFLKEYKKVSTTLISKTINSEKKFSHTFITGIIIAIKNFDRYIDNTIYIIENFLNF